MKEIRMGDKMQSFKDIGNMRIGFCAYIIYPVEKEVVQHTDGILVGVKSLKGQDGAGF
jgi:hypothetical protein